MGGLRFLSAASALALVTLWLLSVLVFVAAQLLPGDVGSRRSSGRSPTQHAVAALNHQLGVDRPLLVQYLDWIATSCAATWARRCTLQRRRCGRPLTHGARQLAEARGASPSCSSCRSRILGGVVAALNVGRPLDRIITIGGLSADGRARVRDRRSS